MICRSCGNNMPENEQVCRYCGTNNEPYTNNTGYTGNNGYANNTSYTNQGSYTYGQYNYGYNTPPYTGGYPVQNNNAPTTKDYLTWMLVYPLINMIPVVGTIIYLVFCVNFAMDKSNQARASYFKAVLITMGIGIAVTIVMAIFMFIFMEAAFDELEEVVPELEEEFELVYSRIRPLFK